MSFRPSPCLSILLPAVCSVLLLGSTGACIAQVTVVKPAAESNPTLVIAGFTGSSEIRAKLEETLRRCDWFEVVAAGSPATYSLTAQVVSGGRDALDVTVTGGESGGLRYRQLDAGAGSAWLVYQAVDTLIGKLFKAPGLCASRIAFSTGAGRKEIAACNFDGSGAEQLTHNGTISTEPSWGPKAGNLVYTLYQNNATSVVLVDVLRRRQRRLSAFRGLNSGADLSPDGRHAAVCLSRDGRIELYTIELAGRALKRLTNDGAVESSPCWSADGSEICYVSDRAGRPQLYIMALRNGGLRRLLSASSEAVSPDWSGASNLICFSAREGGQYVIGVANPADRTGQRRLIACGPGDWESPSWAPDGRHVVCTQTVRGGRRLCMVDTWYGRAVPITAPGQVSLPSWSDLH